MYVEVSDVKKSYGEGGSYMQVLKQIPNQMSERVICIVPKPLRLPHFEPGHMQIQTAPSRLKAQVPILFSYS